MESVDRNIDVEKAMPNKEVALRMESVERNLQKLCIVAEAVMSLSVWRAWIEIVKSIHL